jgi:hypothetical protein
VQGFDRGDAPLLIFNVSNLYPLVVAGQAHALLATARAPKGFLYAALYNQLPTITQYFTKNPPKTKTLRTQAAALGQFVQTPSYLFASQTGVSGYKVDALRAAIKFALAQPTVKSELLSQGLLPGYSDPVAAKTLFAKNLVAWKSLTCFASLAPYTSC